MKQRNAGTRTLLDKRGSKGTRRDAGHYILGQRMVDTYRLKHMAAHSACQDKLV